MELLIRILENDEARQRLIGQLEQLQRTVSPETSTDPLEQFSDYLDRKQEAFDHAVLNVVASWNRVPEFVTWIRAELANPLRRGIWLDVFVRLSAVFFLGYAVVWLLNWFWPRPAQSQETAKIVVALIREIVAVGAYAVSAMSLLLWFNQPLLTRLVGTDLILAILASSLWNAVLIRAALPLLPELVGEIRATDIVKHLRRAGTIAVSGYFVMRALLRLGLPWSFHSFGLHLLFLTSIAILIYLVLSIREPIAQEIRQMGSQDLTFIRRILPFGFLAQIWHIAAIGLILAHFATWSLSLEGGFYFLAQATSASFAILFCGRLLSLYNDKVFAKGVEFLPVDDEKMPEVHQRASRYANPIRLIFRWAIAVAVFLALSWVWRTGLIEWLGGETGRQFIATLLRLVVFVVLAVTATEAIAILANRFVKDTTPPRQPPLSNRAKTLVSLLKNVGIALVIAIAIMMSLSEIGVDAAALFAGAGVIGLAIGFGSQRLVQDLINGLFILLGDTVRVGDVIETAGKAGAVESMSMRTISLRAYDGSVHTVPYSSIDTVTNMTKDFSFAVFEIGVSYGSDLELAFRELQDLDQAMRREWPYRRLILSPIEIAGVDALADSAVMIKARIKVRAGEQWGIRREFTKRMKIRFDKAGIEIPFPHRTLLIHSEAKNTEKALPETALSPTMSQGNG